jgi:pimeloyl-ACP methyl ester carboxylesterase
MLEARDHPLSIRCDDTGQGEPALLFMPGWCASHAAFSDLIPKSARHRRVLALDWRGHGRSEMPSADFGEEGLVEDALSVIHTSGASQVIPVALAHAGWVAIELRRKLGDQVPKLVLIDWTIMEAPAPFLGALQALQDPAQWQPTRDQLFSMWLEDIDNPALINFVRQDMGAHGSEMWGRAGREIASAYARMGSPLNALSALNPPVPVLHLYAQPNDPTYLAAQRSFATSHPWFSVQKLQARSHFPMFEVPDEMVAAIETFVAG